MSYHEKRNIVSIISTLVITAIYFWIVMHRYPSEGIDSGTLFSFWGGVILILIPVSIAAKIIVSIGFSIIYRMTSDEEEPAFSDERDKFIELKATRNSHWVFVFGLLAAMGSQVIHCAPSVMFIILIISGLVSEIVGNVSQLYFYREGI